VSVLTVVRALNVIYCGIQFGMISDLKIKEISWIWLFRYNTANISCGIISRISLPLFGRSSGTLTILATYQHKLYCLRGDPNDAAVFQCMVI